MRLCVQLDNATIRLLLSALVDDAARALQSAARSRWTLLELWRELAEP